MQDFIQKKKVGVAGSFINQMMGNNNSLPKVGEFVTFLHYSDRKVGKVIQVSDDLSTVRIQCYDTRADLSNHPEGLPHGHQCWIHEPSEEFATLEYSRGAWRQVYYSVTFTKRFREEMIQKYRTEYFVMHMPEDEKAEIYAGQVYPQNVVEGKTVKRKRTQPVSVIFGVCDYYYDWEF
jgi:hypothetical protein